MNSYKWIAEYIEYLNSTYGLIVSIRDFCGFMPKSSAVANALLPYCIHTSPFCMYIKEDVTMLDRCASQGRILIQKCKQHDSPFVTTCYCGYSDLVIPVKFNGEVVAAVCVGGFEVSRETAEKRIAKQAQRYSRPVEVLKANYEKSITCKTSLLNIQKTCSVISDFLLMYYSMLHASGLVDAVPKYMDVPATLNLLNSIDHFIHTHYSSNIHVEDIAAHLNCSRSYVSHIFKQNMNRSIPTYINEVRVSHAKRMLLEESNITKVSEACGFASPSYFSSIFTKYVGMSPSQYRRSFYEMQ